ncbi:MAG: insulinase family protein [Candidatus Cloacimonetes bacterium]|nr:insulinase family protein [Candidatus Cloacimonadota bacterium]MCF7813314.1 insulinase family protein [Candidatus Cloacimonadota bacterium]MCF7867389.1 insulinase family protein [Candidatus Cloacimonadota bacterium]MCF7882823.1 insulinase family protein [Candidatus Cloacimonadota bacterium]
MNVTSTVLENKFKAILATDNSNPLVCLQFYVRIGSSWEEKNEAGFSHFTEHLVFKSTEKFPRNSIMEQVTVLGGTINAFTEYDITCFYITLPSRFLQEGMEIISQLALKADFKQQEFDSEKLVIIEELKQYKNDPEDSFVEEIAENYFENNPYKNPIIGNLDSLKTATRKDLQDFYKKYYVPNNCFLVISGDINEEKTTKLLDEYFLDWKPKRLAKRTLSKVVFPSEPGFTSFHKKISNDMLAFAFPDLSENNPESYALSLAVKAFAIGKSSRLYKRLFDEEKLIDSIRVNSLSGINDGAALINVMPKKKADLNKIILIFLEELRRFITFGMSHQELSDNKKEMIFYHRYAFEYVESLATSLGGEEVLSGFESFFEYPKLISKIEIAQTLRVIRKFLAPNLVHIFHKGMQKLDEDKILSQFQESISFKSSEKSRKKVMQQTLENGMKIIMKKVKGKPTVGVSISFEVSQLNEDKSNLGINLLTAGLMLYGNEKRNYQQFLNFCTTNGINFGITPQAETTSVKLKCFNEMLPVGLELLADVVQTPTFPNDFFHNLKNSYMSNIDREKDYPIYSASRSWKEMMFGKYSNVISRSGYKKTLRTISLRKIQKWYETHFHPKNMTLAVVGDINFDVVLKTCQKLFRYNENRFKSSIQKPIIEPSSKSFKQINKNSDQAVICLGGFGCTASETKKNTAFHVLSQIIGGDTNSLLFNELREKRGLAYSVEFNYRSVRDFGYYDAVAIVDKANQKQALEVIKQVLNDVKTKGISKEELQKTKNYVRGIRLMEEESMLNQAQTLSVLEAIGFGYEYYKNRDKRLEEVNLKLLRELAEQYFNENEYFIQILT